MNEFPGRTRRRVEYLVILALLGIANLARAEVAIPAIFSDHAVLQRSAKTPVWGRAAAREKVEVRFDGISRQTVADETGRWQVSLDLEKSGSRPGELVIEGTNRLVFTDVVVGSVWLCAGQSNMEFAM